MLNKYINEIICGDNVEVLREFPNGCIDLTVTSPPYDNLRMYDGFEWDFEGIARELFRSTKDGGVVVWVVGDATVNGSESGTSFRQALYFMDVGFRLHDTLIYEKTSPSPPSPNRYLQAFEYMFVFSKGSPSTFNPINDRRNKYGGTKSSNNGSIREKDGSLTRKPPRVIPKYSRRYNIWRYSVGFMHHTSDKYAYEHPAMFPEKLAEDHITSWSNVGDIVLDPFVGSGTTAKMAALNGRKYIGIDISEDYCDLARRRVCENIELSSR